MKPCAFLPRLSILAASACLLLAAPAVGAGNSAAAATSATKACPRGDHMTTEQAARLKKKQAKKKKTPFDKPGEAQAWFLRQRTDGEPLDYSRLAAAKKQVAAMTPRAPGDIQKWVELGPGNIGGRTRALLVDPANANNIFAAGVSGGVWKTSNGGASWEKLDDLMTNLAVCTLAFPHTNPATLNTKVIYAGTGEGYFNGDSVRGAGIFKTSDGGSTWKQLPATANPNFYYVNKIVTSPNSPQTVYAATRTGVWRSTNGGDSWTRVLAANGSGFPNGTIEDTQTL